MGTMDQEVRAITDVSAALLSLGGDSRAQQRVLEWAWSKYVAGSSANPVVPQSEGPTTALQKPDGASNEIPGVACITAEGELKITARDLKAKNAKDAAIRLAHVAIYAYGKMTGETSVSSRKVLVGLMKEWRVYDGNTRNTLSSHKGILRSGDNLSLDAHSKVEAEKYIEEIQNPSLQGAWRPSASGSRRRKKGARALTTKE